MSDDKARIVTVPATVAEQLSAVANVVRKYAEAAASSTELAGACAALDLIAADLQATEAAERGATLRLNVACQEAFVPARSLLKATEFPLDAFLITDRSGVMEALRAMKSYSDSLTDTVEAVVLLIDADGHILRSNAYARMVSGHAPEALLGRDWCDLLIPEAERPEARGMVRRALAGGAARTGVLTLTALEPPERAIAWSARAVAAGSATVRVVLLGHDVTDLQGVQSRLLQAERLAAVGQAVAGLAHESRNALQRSQACLEMLAAQLKGQPEALRQVERIQQAQDDLHFLYQEVQGYASPVRLKPQLCDLAEVWRAAWAELTPQRGGRDAQLQEAPNQADLRCVVSPFHMQQVFRNIFDNSLSVCQNPAHVMLRCTEVSLRGKPAVTIYIEDNGPGFGREERQRAFEPFFTNKARGTGLGLPICKRIVEAHAGRIEIDEGNGSGAVIAITLPRQRPA